MGPCAAHDRCSNPPVTDPSGTDALEALLDVARTRPDAPAITDPQGRTLSHGELGSRIRSMAGGLQQHGFGIGDRILLSLRPGRPGVALALAAVLAGGSVVCGDPDDLEDPSGRSSLGQPTWEARESIGYAAARTRVGSSRREQVVTLTRAPQHHIHAGPWLPGVPRSSLSLRRLLAASPLTPPPADPSREAVIDVTRGQSSGAMVHTRGALGGVTPLGGTPDDVLSDRLLLGLPVLAGGGHWRLAASPLLGA